MPSWYPEGNLSLPSDDPQRSLHKIVDMLGGGVGVFTGGGAGSGFVFSGNYGGAAPTDTPSAGADGGVAYDLDPPNAIWYWNPSTQSWF